MVWAGANAGGVASKLAIQYVKEYIQSEFKNIDESKENVENLIRTAIINANNYVYNKANENSEYSGMGTTISVALIIKNKVFIGHVGDSRIYRIRKQIMRQLTKDHSYVQELLQKGEITKEKAENHPQKNILMKVLGCEKELEPDVMTRGFLKDDILMMCSDGLTNMIEIEEIHDEISGGKGNFKSICNKLINKSNSNGGYDNVSVILVLGD